MGAGSGWVFFSERVIAPTILSLFESLRALLVVWSLALLLCREREVGECTRGARLCCAMASARRAMGSPMRKRKGAGRGGAACRGDVPLVAFVVLAAKATLRGRNYVQLPRPFPVPRASPARRRRARRGLPMGWA